MRERSPVELLGAILDEVEGLRRIDPKSHLPKALLREAREVIGGVCGARQLLSDTGDLVGRTIDHVFTSGLLRGDALFLCSDGSYLVLAIDGTGDDAGIGVRSNAYTDKGIAEFLSRSDLCEIGLMSQAQRLEEECQEELKSAQAAVSAARQRLANAKAALERDNCVPGPV